MTQLFRLDLPDITFAQAAQDSRVVDSNIECFDAEAILIQAPASVDGKTYTIQVSQDGVNYATLTDTAANNIKVPGDGVAILYNGILTAARFWKLHASAGVSVALAFKFSKSFRA